MLSRRSAWIHLALFSGLLSIPACGPIPAPSTAAVVSRSPSGDIALPTAEPLVLPSGAVEACGGVGISAVLRGDPHDPHVAWLVNNLGTRVNITWPPGYRARFNPGLEVLDAAGAVVLKDGDSVTGGCVTSNPDLLHLEPPFN